MTNRVIPVLREQQTLALQQRDDVPEQSLRLGAQADARITFISEIGAQKNSLGVYLIGQNGELKNPKLVFSQITSSATDPSRSKDVVDSEFDLTPRTSVLLSELYSANQLAPDLEIGVFLIANGASLNDFASMSEGEFRFVDPNNSQRATIATPTPELIHVDHSSASTEIKGTVFHAVNERRSEDAASLNPDGLIHAVAGEMYDVVTIESGGHWTAHYAGDPTDGWTDIDYADAVYFLPSDVQLVGSPDDRSTAYEAESVISGTNANFIWRTGGSELPGTKGDDVAFFRHEFLLPNTEKNGFAGNLTIAADDDFELYVNGQLAFSDDNGHLDYNPTTLTPLAFEVDIGPYLQGGDNVIAVRAENTGYIKWLLVDGWAGAAVDDGGSLIAFEDLPGGVGASDQDFNDVVIGVDPTIEPAVLLENVPAYAFTGGCAPTAGASILGYWDVHGYDALFEASGWKGVRLTENVREQISSSAHEAKYDPKPDDPDLPDPPDTSLADFMHTSEGFLPRGWTNSSDIGKGIREYAAAKGYAFNAYRDPLDETNIIRIWEELKLSVDEGRPLIVGTENAEGYYGHVMPVVGYQDRGYGGRWYAVLDGAEEEMAALRWYEFVPSSRGWGVGDVTFISPAALAHGQPLQIAEIMDLEEKQTASFWSEDTNSSLLGEEAVSPAIDSQSIVAACQTPLDSLLIDDAILA